MCFRVAVMSPLPEGCLDHLGAYCTCWSWPIYIFYKGHVVSIHSALLLRPPLAYAHRVHGPSVDSTQVAAQLDCVLNSVDEVAARREA